MRTDRFDLEYCQNNGTIAIRPSKTGRLKEFCRTNVRGTDRVWVFQNTVTYLDEDGDERQDHIARGVLNGSHGDGCRFLDMCRELGFIVQHTGIFVPFSNGQHRYGKISNRDGSYTPITDYCSEELKSMRWDLPTREQLTPLLDVDVET